MEALYVVGTASPLEVAYPCAVPSAGPTASMGRTGRRGRLLEGFGASTGRSLVHGSSSNYRCVCSSC